MAATTRVAIGGAAGRMGRTLIEACAAQAGVRLVAAFEAAGHPSVGEDAGRLAGSGDTGVQVRADGELGAEPAVDVLVEFTSPQATLAHLDRCRELGIRMVIGTTGLSAAQRAKVVAAGEQIAVVLAPNMSVGVNLCFALVRSAAKALGADYDVEIIEAHHRHKLDSPSGTALRLGEVVADELGFELATAATYGRQGQVGPRPAGQIGFATLRGGDIVGDHTVLFAGPGERIEISHRASNRMTFANGALRAAQWLAGKDKGLYDMQDVLGLG